jgi:hypothetical protein
MEYIDTDVLVLLMDRVVESEEATVRHMSDDVRSTPVGRWLIKATAAIETLNHNVEELQQKLDDLS